MSLPQVLIEKLISVVETNEVTINNVQEISNSIPRRERIQSLLRTDHLNIEEKKILLTIYEEYSDVFYLEGDQLPCTPKVEHKINTRIDSANVNVRLYRLSEKHKVEVNRQIQEMLDQNIIRPSVS